MGRDSNAYSVELMSHSLLEAAKAAASSPDESEIISAYLNQLLIILESNCAIFYPADASPLNSRTAIRAHSSGKRELAAPVSITRQTQAFVRNAEHQVVTSDDPIFSMGHLRALVLPNAAASLWIAVTAREAHYGTIVLLEQSRREFIEVELDVARTFALQLGHALSGLKRNVPIEEDRPESSYDLARHLESSKLMSVVSRDLINPLTAMLGYIDLLLAEPLDEKPQHYIARLQGQVEKVQNIILSINSSSSQTMPQAAPAVAPMATLQPRYTPPPMSMPLELPSPVEGTRPRILLIQKNEALIEFQRSVLSGMMIDPVISLTGADAVTLLQSEEVQAVILDDELDGEWPGRKLLNWILANKPELNERILLTVSSRPKAEIRELIEKSNIAYISKPLQMGALLTGVQQILGYQRVAESKLLH
jgi:CheY-like chemotaxis protein